MLPQQPSNNGNFQRNGNPQRPPMNYQQPMNQRPFVPPQQFSQQPGFPNQLQQNQMPPNPEQRAPLNSQGFQSSFRPVSSMPPPVQFVQPPGQPVSQFPPQRPGNPQFQNQFNPMNQRPNFQGRPGIQDVANQFGNMQLNEVSPGRRSYPTAPLEGQFIRPGPNQQVPFQQQPAFSAPKMASDEPHQSRVKIDPSHMPSPILGQVADQENWKTAHYLSVSDNIPPLVTSDFVAIDNGNATCRFVRSCSYNVPCTSEVANNSKLPIALIVQPLAEVKPQEVPVYVVDSGVAEDKGPVRCSRCKAYVNPNFVWLNGGRRFGCNICEFVNETPEHYFCPVDQNGFRVDWAQRPELRQGVVEFRATKEFYGRTPVPARFLFVVDVSYNAVQSGIVSTLADAVKEMLDYFPKDESSDESPCELGLITYDKVVHFYNLSHSTSQPQMMVVSELNDIFVPLQTGLFVNPHKATENLEKLFSLLNNAHSSPRPSNENCFGSAMQAAHLALKKTGGRILAFNTSLPTVGQGVLKTREEMKLINTEDEKQLFIPQDNFYQKLAENLVDCGTGVDLFAFPTAYMDLATLGILSSMTGGSTIMYPRFQNSRDGISLAQDIQRAISRPFGYDSVLRVRCGNGLRVEEHFGNFTMRNSTDLEMPLVDSETAFAVKFANDGTLLESKRAQFQIAMLYTTSLGERRIRVLNLALRCTMQVGLVFRAAEIDAFINYVTKAELSKANAMSLKAIRDKISENCVDVLVGYRKACASSSPPGQLVLPDSLKLLPVYTLAVLKSRPFKAANDIASDMRIEAIRNVRGMNVATSVTYFYPRVFSLHNMSEDSCTTDEQGRFVFPKRVRCSFDSYDSRGIFLLENTREAILWIGANVDTNLIEELFEAKGIEGINPALKELPYIENEISKKVRELLYHIQETERKGIYCPLIIIRQGEQEEIRLRQLLVEDEGYESMDYVRYVCLIHKQIQDKLSPDDK